MTESASNRVPEGEDVLSFIARLGGPAHAWMSGVGTVEGAEIAVARGADDESVAVPGRSTLVSLTGPRGGPLMAVLARAGADGVKLFAGRLVKARSAGVSLVLGEWQALPEPNPDIPRAVVPRAGLGPSAPSDDDEADEVPKFGDRVDHFVFGLCDVMVVRGERMKIREVKGPGKLREIHVGPFKVLRPVEVDGKRVFRLMKRP